jgi:PAS domain S-box-containing protein
MKILIAYYSRTKSTKDVALTIKKRLEERGHTIDTEEVHAATERSFWNWFFLRIFRGECDIEEPKIKNASEYDAICIGSPNWTRLSLPMARYLSQLDGLKYKKLGLFSTTALWPFFEWYILSAYFLEMTFTRIAEKKMARVMSYIMVSSIFKNWNFSSSYGKKKIEDFCNEISVSGCPLKEYDIKQKDISDSRLLAALFPPFLLLPLAVLFFVFHNNIFIALFVIGFLIYTIILLSLWMKIKLFFGKYLFAVYMSFFWTLVVISFHSRFGGVMVVGYVILLLGLIFFRSPWLILSAGAASFLGYSILYSISHFNEFFLIEFDLGMLLAGILGAFFIASRAQKNLLYILESRDDLEIERCSLESRVIERTKVLNDITDTLRQKETELIAANKDMQDKHDAMLNLVEDMQKLEGALRESKQKFQSLIDSSSDCIKLLDENGKLLFLNKGGLAEHGFETPEEAMDWDYMDTIENEYRPKIRESLKKALEGKVVSFDVKHTQDKAIMGRSNREWCNMTFSPLSGVGDKITSVLVVSRDVTENKKAQEDLKKEKESVELKVKERTRQLREEQARLTASINSLSFGFVLLDLADKILLKNPAVGRILEIPEDKITSESIKEYFKYVDMGTYHDLCIKEKRSFEVNDLEAGKKVLRLLFAPVIISKEQEEEVIGHILLIEDTTEAKIIERSREEFFAVASHEMRTPLTAIRGNASMIKDLFSGKAENKEAFEMVSDIYEASVRLIGIVNDFLDASRLEQGKMEFKKEQFDLYELAQHIVAGLQEMARAKGLSLKLEKPKLVFPKALADKNKAEQVILNLIANAINYTQAGGVSVKLDWGGGLLGVYVTDTGVGIAPKNQALLFRKFQQAGENILTRNVTQSSGLGLYISKLLAEKMGGNIELIKSQVGVGSTFVFTLPVVFSKKEV